MPQEDEFEYPGNNLFSNLKEDICRRGVCVYIKSNLKASRTFLYDGNFSESVWCEVRLQGSDHILVGGIYRSPNSTEANNEALNSFIKQCKKPSHVLINGDFNHPEINWEHMISTKNDDHKSSKFLETVMDSFLF